VDIFKHTAKKNRKLKRADQILPEVYGTTLSKIWQLFLTIWTLQDKQYTYVAGENKMYLFSLRNRYEKLAKNTLNITLENNSTTMHISKCPKLIIKKQ
jgi:flagellar motor switch protein FliM